VKSVPLYDLPSSTDDYYRLYRRTMIGYHERVMKRITAAVPIVCPAPKYVTEENEHLVPREYVLTWESMLESEISKKQRKS